MPTTPKKLTTRKTAKPAAAKAAGAAHAEKAEKTERKARAARAAKPEAPVAETVVAATAPAAAPVHKKEVEPVAEMDLAEGKYSYAVGRRKTSVANIRLFSGRAKSQVNKKDLAAYFGGNQHLIDLAHKPLQLTGLENRVHVYVNVKGGGKHSQAEAISHGIALAIATHNPEFRKVLKKNGTLTRDSRMKERKKPGLKRARRGPQWAKR